MTVEELAIEQAANVFQKQRGTSYDNIPSLIRECFAAGAKAFHTKGMYDDDDVWKLLNKYLDYQEHGLDNLTTIEWFEQNKKK